VPVVLAVGVRREPGLGNLCFAAGSGMTAEDAVRAALCETASYVAGFDERVRRDLAEVRAMVTDYDRVTELSHHALLFGLPEMAERAAFLFDAPPLATLDELHAGWEAERPTTGDLTEDLRALMARVVALGSDVIAVEQTCPEQRRSGVHTMAVIAPGLVPIDFGWARQRVLHHPRFTRWLARTGGTAYPHPHPFP
jgi:ribosomal protein S12 methylthiotransferase accessory factor